MGGDENIKLAYIMLINRSLSFNFLVKTFVSLANRYSSAAAYITDRSSSVYTHILMLRRLITQTSIQKRPTRVSVYHLGQVTTVSGSRVACKHKNKMAMHSQVTGNNAAAGT